MSINILLFYVKGVLYYPLLCLYCIIWLFFEAITFMAGPSQPQVTDEVWDDDRVRSFLMLETFGTESPDFQVLLAAYRGMRPDDFSRFLSFYIDAGRDLDAQDKKGRTLWQIISKHRRGVDFLRIKQTFTKPRTHD